MKTNFVIFSQSRSGSSLLVELLDSHPEIHCDGELFNLDHGYVKDPVMLAIWKKMPYSFIYCRRVRSAGELYGFKLFDHHLSRAGRVIHILHKMGWKIIYLKRDDIVRQALSEIIATSTGQWHRAENETIKDRVFTISVDKFIEKVEGRIMLRDVERNILQTLPHYTMTYEESLKNTEDWQHSLNDLFDHLGVKKVSVRANLRKMYDRSYSEMVENYDDLIEAVKHSKYSKILDTNPEKN